MIQIPKNRIIENQHTNGSSLGKNLSLRFSLSKIPYIGYYCIINGSKYFSGKVYDEKSKPLERYNILATASHLVAAAGSIATLANSSFGKQEKIRYFYKDLTSKSILIKEIDKDAYNKLSGEASMIYQVIQYNQDKQILEEVNKQMYGLKTFLET